MTFIRNNLPKGMKKNILYHKSGTAYSYAGVTTYSVSYTAEKDCAVCFTAFVAGFGKGSLSLSVKVNGVIASASVVENFENKYGGSLSSSRYYRIIKFSMKQGDVLAITAKNGEDGYIAHTYNTEVIG